MLTTICNYLRVMMAGAAIALLIAAPLVRAVAADPPGQKQEQGPAELIDMVAHQVLKELDSRRAEMRKDPRKIRKLSLTSADHRGISHGEPEQIENARKPQPEVQAPKRPRFSITLTGGVPT